MSSISAAIDRDGPGGPRPLATRRRLTRERARSLAIDAACVLFFAGVTGVFNQIATPTSERYFWIVADLTVVLLLAVHTGDFLRVASRNKLLLSWPAIACISTAWSLAPSISLYHGLQLLMTTLTGFALCLYLGRDKVVQLIFIALAACVIGSMVFAVTHSYRAWGVFGELQGLYHHKNQMGVYSALLAVTAACLFLQGWHRFITAAGFAVGMALLMASRSGSALVCMFAAMAPLPFAICYRQGPRTMSFAMGVTCIFASIGLLAIAATIAASNAGLLDALLDALGKGRTLTGRTVLWDLGTQAFRDNPWLGLGYKGYWEGATARVNHLHVITGQALWFFHNNVLEVAVAFGIMGPILLLGAMGQALFRTIRAFIRQGSYTDLWRTLVVLFLAAYMNAENPLFQNHSFHNLLFVIAAVAYLGPRPKPRRLLRL